MRLPRRRILWLGAVLLLAVIVGAWFLVPRSRITQANFERIHKGMSEEEVRAILDEPYAGARRENQAAAFWPDADPVGRPFLVERVVWHRGPDWIRVTFINDAVFNKQIHLATLWDTLTWYAEEGAEKIGVKWD